MSVEVLFKCETIEEAQRCILGDAAMRALHNISDYMRALDRYGPSPNLINSKQEELLEAIREQIDNIIFNAVGPL